jgi:hypothetical protein
MPLNAPVVEKLKIALPDLLVLTPQSLGYEKSLERQTINGEKRAVSPLMYHK